MSEGKALSARIVEQYAEGHTCVDDRLDECLQNFGHWYKAQPWYRRAWWRLLAILAKVGRVREGER